MCKTFVQAVLTSTKDSAPFTMTPSQALHLVPMACFFAMDAVSRVIPINLLSWSEKVRLICRISSESLRRYTNGPPGELGLEHANIVSESIDRLLLNYDEFIGDLPWNKHIVTALSVGWDDGFVFPYLNSKGNLVNIKWHKKRQVRGHAQTFIFPFWHMIHKYTRVKPLFICEGEKDCVSLISSGKQAISFNNGASTRVPKPLMDVIQGRFNDIFLYYDDDEAGRKATDNFLSSYGQD